MAVHFSNFDAGGLLQTGDIVVGLRNSTNYKFTFPGPGFNDANGNLILSWVSPGTAAIPAVNSLQINSAVAGTNPGLTPIGTDANIGVDVSTKGTGTFNVLGTGGMIVPHGTTAQRPVGSPGLIRANLDTGLLEFWDNLTGSWVTNGVSSINVAAPLTTTGGLNPTIGLATPLAGIYGGTGVNNGAHTLTLAGNLATVGAFAATFNFTAPTNVTFPVAGTLATTAAIPAFPLSPANGGTGVANVGTITVGGNTAFTGAFTFNGALAANTAVNFPTTGTLATTAQLPAILNFSLVAQGAVPVQAPGTIKYESTTIYTSIVNGKNYAIGVGFIGSPTLTIWDISAPISPVLVGTFVAAGGGAYNCTVGVVGGVQYAFIGYNSGSHFVVVNLTNPAAPVQVSNTVITGTAGSIYGVSFLNGFVYCATQNIGLVVMDVGGGIGTPTIPIQTYTQGATKSFGVVAIGTNVYTTQFSTASPFTIRQIISWTLTGAGTPSIPSLLQSLQVTSAGEALGLSVSGNTAFVTTAAVGAYNIDLVDITTPTAMTNLSQINSTNTFNSAFFAVANGNYLYIPSGSNATYGGAIDAYDITVRTAPVHIAQVTTGQPNSVFGAIALSGGYIFCADYGTVANNGYFDVFTQINATAIFGQITTSTINVNSLTPNTALVSSATDGIISSVTTATELSYVHGVTSSIQTQINALAGGFVYNQVAGTAQALAVNNGYQTNSAALTTLTLPTVAAFGTIIDVVGYGAGLFVIAQNAGQIIHSGNVDTTLGVGGSIASTYRYCSIQLLCSVANTEFTVLRQNGEFLIT